MMVLKIGAGFLKEISDLGSEILKDCIIRRNEGLRDRNTLAMGKSPGRTRLIK
jgi:hypothetical protein